MFNTIYTDTNHCFETCLNYNKAQAPIFTDQVEMTELITWAKNTTMDPETNTYYKDVVSATFWLPIRFII